MFHTKACESGKLTTNRTQSHQQRFTHNVWFMLEEGRDSNEMKQDLNILADAFDKGKRSQLQRDLTKAKSQQKQRNILKSNQPGNLLYTIMGKAKADQMKSLTKLYASLLLQLKHPTSSTQKRWKQAHSLRNWLPEQECSTEAEPGYTPCFIPQGFLPRDENQTVVSF